MSLRNWSAAVDVFWSLRSRLTGWLSACRSAGETLLDGSEVSGITDGRLSVGVALDAVECVCVSGTTWREVEGTAIAIDSGGL